MLQSLYWRNAFDSPLAEAELDEFRGDTLRLFLALSAVGYFGWHVIDALIWPEDIPRRWALVPVVVPALVASYLLLRVNRWVAAVTFVTGGVLSISWALYSLKAAQVAMFYPVLALAAAFVVHPLAGFVVGGTAVGLMTWFGTARPGLIGLVDVGSVLVFSSLAVTGVWAVMHRLFLALTWYVHSYADAARRTREAEEHRAQLVQAWTQLDAAYGRLERANAALQFAWRAADEAERSKMELATNLSHELRTPLNLIVGYSEMMMTSPSSYGGVALPQPYRLDLNAVYRSAQHLLALTDDILDLARMEIGRLGLLREPVDLGQVVRDAALLVKEYVEAKGLELRVELPESVPTLVVDRLRIRQVLLNLLTNAARLTEHGRIEVRLAVGEQHVRVSVTDTGPGIALDDQSSIFERFGARVASNPRGRSGTGLGLPISKRLVELHGGEMDVESAVGVGTTFWFTLPLAPDGDAEMTPTLERPVLTLRSSQEQVLILVGSDVSLARLMQRHLQGYRIEVANDLASAESRALELRATAIVADLCALPDPSAARVPVVQCSLPRPERLAVGLGVDGYLVKPISREALLSAIQGLGCPVNRLLIVDDDAWFAQLLTRMLISDGRAYRVSVAYGGEEALAKMRSDRPDLLLLDLAMPGLDGMGVLSQMATDPGLRGVKVIVVSGHGEGDGAVPLGGEIRITKTEGFRLAELTQVIGAAVSKLLPVRTYLDDTEPRPPQARPA